MMLLRTHKEWRILSRDPHVGAVAYERITVDPGEYVHHGFPDAFSAHWVRLRTDRGGVVTAQFVYHRGGSFSEGPRRRLLHADT